VVFSAICVAEGFTASDVTVARIVWAARLKLARRAEAAALAVAAVAVGGGVLFLAVHLAVLHVAVVLCARSARATHRRRKLGGWQRRVWTPITGEAEAALFAGALDTMGNLVISLAPGAAGRVAQILF
jgi:ABC-type cobalt transport system substrate-binding protein